MQTPDVHKINIFSRGKRRVLDLTFFVDKHNIAVRWYNFLQSRKRCRVVVSAMMREKFCWRVDTFGFSETKGVGLNVGFECGFEWSGGSRCVHGGPGRWSCDYGHGQLVMVKLRARQRCVVQIFYGQVIRLTVSLCGPEHRLTNLYFCKATGGAICNCATSKSV